MMMFLALVAVLLIVVILTCGPSSATDGCEHGGTYLSGIRVEYTHGEIASRTYLEIRRSPTAPDGFPCWTHPISHQAAAYVRESPAPSRREARRVDQLL